MATHHKLSLGALSSCDHSVGVVKSGFNPPPPPPLSLEVAQLSILFGVCVCLVGKAVELCALALRIEVAWKRSCYGKGAQCCLGNCGDPLQLHGGSAGMVAVVLGSVGLAVSGTPSKGCSGGIHGALRWHNGMVVWVPRGGIVGW